MKFKTVIVFIIFFIASRSAFAQDLSIYCAAPHDLSKSSTQALSKVTGATYISQNIANAIIKRELRNSAGMKGLKVNIKSFSANDLLAGRFKSLTIKGSNLNFDGIYISKFNAQTICDFNNIRATKTPVIFRDNFAMKYAMTFTDTDIKKTVASQKYHAILAMINIKSIGLDLFKLKDVDVKLKDDKFVFLLKMDNRVFGYNMPINMEVSTKLKVENGRIKTTELAFEGLNQKINLTQLTNVLNLINPLSVSTNILGNENAKVAVENLKIEKSRLVLDGTVFVPKSQKIY